MFGKPPSVEHLAAVRSQQRSLELQREDEAGRELRLLADVEICQQRQATLERDIDALAERISRIQDAISQGQR